MWGGPVLFLQAKNAPFYIDDIPEEFNRPSQVLHEWFGHRISDYRRVILVYAVNTYLTRELKHLAYAAGASGNVVHILDAVDILHAEELKSDYSIERDNLTVF